MRAHVDKDTCISCELCTQICPEVFSMDDDGKSVAINDDVPTDSKNEAKQARDECPVSAIDISD